MPRLRLPYLKLRWQLLLSYLPVLLIPILVISIVVRGVAERGLTVLVTQEAQQRAATVSGVFAQFYLVHGNWYGIETVFEELQRGPNQGQNQNPLPPGIDQPPRGPNGQYYGNPPPRITPIPRPTQVLNGRGRLGQADQPQPGQFLITDTTGVVVASDNSNADGQVLSPEALAQGVPLVVNGKEIGTLVIGAAFGVLNAQENQLLDSVSSALLITGLIMVLLVIALVLWLSQQLTAPARALIKGVRHLAAGEWSQPVTISSHNEFADLTQAFNGMAEQLTRQQQQQRQLIADIAHDLRTPLSVMALEVAGIKAGLQTPEEATTSLQEEIDWLQHLIDDLHTLSLMDTGRLDLRLDATALSPYLTTVGNQWQAMATKQDKTLRCDLPPDLPVAQIDPFRLKQVLGNLLNNALQHTPAGTSVLLRAVVNQVNIYDPGEVVITVADNGPGIPEGDVPHIFERFYRADRARNRGSHEHGSGLGLSIAYQLVALHGGVLDVKSALGKGTAFYIHLPLPRPKAS